MPREFHRSDRVGAQIQREVAELLRAGGRDPELGMVTLNEVTLSRDLAVARLYVTFLAAQLPPERCIARLNERASALRHELGRRLRIRVLPELRFLHDDSIDRGMRLDTLLAELNRESGPDGDPE